MQPALLTHVTYMFIPPRFVLMGLTLEAIELLKLIHFVLVLLSVTLSAGAFLGWKQNLSVRVFTRTLHLLFP